MRLMRAMLTLGLLCAMLYMGLITLASFVPSSDSSAAFLTSNDAALRLESEARALTAPRAVSGQSL